MGTLSKWLYMTNEAYDTHVGRDSAKHCRARKGWHVQFMVNTKVLDDYDLSVWNENLNVKSQYPTDNCDMIKIY